VLVILLASSFAIVDFPAFIEPLMNMTI